MQFKTLQEILQEEPLVLVDTCVFPHKRLNRKGIKEESIELAKEFAEMASCENVVTIPSIIDELNAFHKPVKERISSLKKVKKKYHQTNFTIRWAYEDCKNVYTILKRGIKRLRERELHLEDDVRYQNLRDLIFLLENKLHIKQEEVSSRTDEEIIAAALYQSMFYDGLAIVSNGHHLFRLFTRGYSILMSPSLEGNQSIIASLREKLVKLYSFYMSEEQYGLIASNELSSTRNLSVLNQDDPLCTFYISHCLANLDKKFPYIQKRLEELASAIS